MSAKTARVLAINPTPPSTQVAVFDGQREVASAELRHRPEELARYQRVWDQYLMRKDLVAGFLQEKGVPLSSMKAVVGCGGLLKPLPAGTYLVNAAMLEDLRCGVRGEHAANLGGILAYGIARAQSIPAYVVDPISTGELTDLARCSEPPDPGGASQNIALNRRWVARQAAGSLGKTHRECSFVVAHLGESIAVAAHRCGRTIDVRHAAGSGGLPPERRVAEGDEAARLAWEALAYLAAKEIGAMAAALRGQVDGVILTGPLAGSALLRDRIREQIAWIGPAMWFPGGDALRTLAEGALRVLRGEEEALMYE